MDDGADRFRNVVNLRDLGGLRTWDGSVTRYGVLYRSDAPYHGDLDPEALPTWPPAVVLDLRSSGEDADGHPWAEQTTVHHLPLLKDAAVVTAHLPAEQVSGRRRMREVYRRIVDTVPDRLASAVRIAAEADGPVLVHCAAGKDRTGITVAVLLLAAGVDPADIVRDYTATEPNMERLLTRLERLGRRLPGVSRPTPSVLGAPRELMEMLIDKLTGAPGGVIGWLEAHGVSAGEMAAWRGRFVAP